MKMSRAIKGQTLIEFAFIIPILILVITLFIDMGRLIFTYSELSNAVREGTRYAIVHDRTSASFTTDINNTIRHYSPSLNPVDFTINPPSISTNIVTITASYNYRAITPGLKFMLPAGFITLQAQSSALFAPMYQQ